MESSGFDWRLTPRQVVGASHDRPVLPYQPTSHHQHPHLRTPSAGQPSSAAEVENWRASLHQRHLTASSDRSFSSYIIPGSGDFELSSPPPAAAASHLAIGQAAPASRTESPAASTTPATTGGRGTAPGAPGEGERTSWSRWARWREEGGSGGAGAPSVRTYSALDGWGAPVTSAAELSAKQPDYPEAPCLVSTAPPPGLATTGFPKRTYSSLFSEQQQQQMQHPQSQSGPSPPAPAPAPAVVVSPVPVVPARPLGPASLGPAPAAGGGAATGVLSPTGATGQEAKRAGIVIKGLPPQVRIRDVLEILAPFGDVSDVSLNQGNATVFLDSFEATFHAVSYLSSTPIFGLEQPLDISLTSQPASIPSPVYQQQQQPVVTAPVRARSLTSPLTPGVGSATAVGPAAPSPRAGAGFGPAGEGPPLPAAFLLGRPEKQLPPATPAPPAAAAPTPSYLDYRAAVAATPAVHAAAPTPARGPYDESPSTQLDRNSVFFANLPDHVSKYLLERTCSIYGPVVRSQILPGNAPAGGSHRVMAFVEFRSTKSAEALLSHLNGKTMFGSSVPLKIEFAKRRVRREEVPPPMPVAGAGPAGAAGAVDLAACGLYRRRRPDHIVPRTVVYVKSSEGQVADIRRRLERYGTILSSHSTSVCSPHASSSGYILFAFKEPSSADYVVKNKILGAMFPRQRRLILEHFPPDVREVDVRAFFEDIGDLKLVDIRRDVQQVWVEFQEGEEAARAVIKCGHYKLPFSPVHLHARYAPSAKKEEKDNELLYQARLAGGSYDSDDSIAGHSYRTAASDVEGTPPGNASTAALRVHPSNGGGMISGRYAQRSYGSVGSGYLPSPNDNLAFLRSREASRSIATDLMGGPGAADTSPPTTAGATASGTPMPPAAPLLAMGNAFSALALSPDAPEETGSSLEEGEIRSPAPSPTGMASHGATASGEESEGTTTSTTRSLHGGDRERWAEGRSTFAHQQPAPRQCSPNPDVEDTRACTAS